MTRDLSKTTVNEQISNCNCSPHVPCTVSILVGKLTRLLFSQLFTKLCQTVLPICATDTTPFSSFRGVTEQSPSANILPKFSTCWRRHVNHARSEEELCEEQ